MFIRFYFEVFLPIQFVRQQVQFSSIHNKFDRYFLMQQHYCVLYCTVHNAFRMFLHRHNDHFRHCCHRHHRQYPNFHQNYAFFLHYPLPQPTHKPFCGPAHFLVSHARAVPSNTSNTTS